MPFDTALHAIDFIAEYSEAVSIGGGEPTLHPRFFDILRRSLDRFDYVWMATNGSRHVVMSRLANIIEDEDYDSAGVDAYSYISAPDKLTVALSQDYWHDASMVKSWVVDRWTRGAARKKGGYEIRDVGRTNGGASAQGRAKRTGAGWGEQCVCPDRVIRPDGSIKLCGCVRSPIIGSVFTGIERKWERVLRASRFTDSNCYFDWRRKTT